MAILVSRYSDSSCGLQPWTKSHRKTATIFADIFVCASLNYTNCVCGHGMWYVVILTCARQGGDQSVWWGSAASHAGSKQSKRLAKPRQTRRPHRATRRSCLTYFPPWRHGCTSSWEMRKSSSPAPSEGELNRNWSDVVVGYQLAGYLQLPIHPTHTHLIQETAVSECNQKQYGGWVVNEVFLNIRKLITENQYLTELLILSTCFVVDFATWDLNGVMGRCIFFIIIFNIVYFTIPSFWIFYIKIVFSKHHQQQPLTHTFSLTSSF